MNEQTIIELGIQSILVAMKVAAPPLLAVMITGAIISMIQAATQINEQTLSFIPKVLAMSFALLFSAPWILKTIIFFTTNIFKSIADVTQ